MKLAMTLFLQAGLFASSAFATGGMASGGGVALVCHHPTSTLSHPQISSVELLDLYEARVLQRLQLVQSTGNPETDYVEAVRRGYAQFNEEKRFYSEPKMRQHYRSVFQSVRWTPPGKRLLPMNDRGFIPPLPPNCYLEQVALFTDDPGDHEIIDINTDLWRRMDPLSQAALFWHELAYKYNRILRERTSENTRREVGQHFALNLIPVLFGIPPNADHCSAIDQNGRLTILSVYKSQAPAGRMVTVLQFTQIQGRTLNQRTTAFLGETDRFHELTKLNLYRGSDGNIYPTLQAPNVNEQMTLPLQGAYRNDLRYRVYFKSGGPVQMSLYQGNELVGDSMIVRCSWLK